MKNKILLVGFVALSLFSCEKKVEVATTTAAPVDADKIKTEIQGLEDAYAKAGNAGDADAVANYYAEDATSFSPNKAPLVGKSAIRESIAQDIKDSPKGTKVSFTTNEVFPSADGNQVVELGAYKVSDSANVTKSTGNYMALFVKKDGKYIAIRDMAASDMKKEEKK